MSRTRRGFTLVELLMVIVVIGILSTLLVSGGMMVISSSREAATRSTLKIVQKIIDDRNLSVSTVIKQKDIDPFLLFGATFSEVIGSVQADSSLTPQQKQGFIDRIEVAQSAAYARMSPYDGADKRLKMIVTMNEWARLLLPQTWEEAEVQRCAKRLPPVDPVNPETENSEVLLFMLTLGKSESLLSIDADSEAITSSMKRDSDGNGEAELVDSWGNQIRFVRWPTRLLRPSGMPSSYNPRIMFPGTPMEIPVNVCLIPESDERTARILIPSIASCGTNPEKPKGSTIDPNDTLALVINKTIPDSSIIAGNTSSEVSAFEQAFYLPNTYHSPIVISPGQDGKHGLLNPVSKADFGYWGKVATAADAFDDITDR